MKAIQKQELSGRGRTPKGGRSKEQRRASPGRAARSITRSATRRTQIFIPPGERLGNKVIEFNERVEEVRRPPADRRPELQRAAGRDHRRHHRPQRRRQVDDLQNDHRAGARIRAIETGPTVQMAYVDQSRDASWKATTRPCSRNGRRPRHPQHQRRRDPVARLHRPLQLQGRDQQKLVGTLSGGERGRLHLAKTLLPGGNVLLLDEPSNDLDIETLRALEDALAGVRRQHHVRHFARPLVPKWTASRRTSSPSRAIRSGRSTPATTTTTGRQEAPHGHDDAGPRRICGSRRWEVRRYQAL